MATKVCKNCLISSKCPDAVIDNDNICNFCHEVEQGVKPIHYREPEVKKQLAEQLDKTLRTIKGKRDFDCIVGLSGGKDSVYLLYKLKKDYPNLRILAVTEDIVFNSKIGRENASKVVEKLDVPHVILRYKTSFYYKVYKYLLEHRPEGGYKVGINDAEPVEERKGLCMYCAQIMHSGITKYAVANQIPLILKGYAPAQPAWAFFEEDPKEIQEKDATPPFMQDEPFTEEDRNNCWNPKRYKEGTEFPRILYPFHVWDYNIDEIRSILLKEGILDKKGFSPASSNCYLNLAMTEIDYQVDGYFNMLPFISYWIRHGLGGKKDWEKTIRFVDFIVPKVTKFSSHPKVKKIEKILGINVKEIIKKAKAKKQA